MNCATPASIPKPDHTHLHGGDHDDQPGERKFNTTRANWKHHIIARPYGEYSLPSDGLEEAG